MKKVLAGLMAGLMLFSLTACTSGSSAEKAETSKTEETGKETEAEETTAEETKAQETEEAKETDPVRIGSLKGPTSMGLAELMNREGTAGIYAFTMETAADAIAAALMKKELDIALIPANLAAVLYQKTEGGITVIDINTLGVLYAVTAREDIASFADLKGQTLYMTGKGTTPEYVLKYLLEKNGMTEEDLTIEYKAEAAEVVSALSADPEAVGILPQPFATVAGIQNEALTVCLDLTEEWEKVQENGSQMVTGVTVVRTEFLEENKEAVEAFLKDQEASAAFTAEDPDKTAEYIEALGIVQKAAIAKKALPYCNITCITGEEMKEALEGYLAVLFDAAPESIGGAMPGEDFYYIP